MWLAHQRGRCALLSGRIETARRWLREALARCEQRQSIGPYRLVLSALATAEACAGRVDLAAQAVVELDELPPFPFVEPEQDLGRAWSLVVAGDLPAGREILRLAAARAATSGYRTCEAWLLHDIVRLGDPSTAVDRLQELAAETEGELVTAYAAHAVAAASARPELLEAVAGLGEQLGALLLAAEAAIEAAQAHQRQGDRKAATAWGVRAATLAGSCEGAQTPALSSVVVVVPLTPRERDVAALAAQGRSSQVIADQLFLSVRTVNNHLQSVYAKLGISGRRQLAGALSPPPDLAQG